MFKARKVAGSATYKQSKTAWNCVVLLRSVCSFSQVCLDIKTNLTNEWLLSLLSIISNLTNWTFEMMFVFLFVCIKYTDRLVPVSYRLQAGLQHQLLDPLQRYQRTSPQIHDSSFINLFILLPFGGPPHMRVLCTHPPPPPTVWRPRVRGGTSTLVLAHPADAQLDWYLKNLGFWSRTYL